MIRKLLWAVALLGFSATAANAAIVTVNYTSGSHTEPWLTAGGNGASNNVVYGDGNNYGISPANKCVDGWNVGCDEFQSSGLIGQGYSNVGPGNGTFVSGNNPCYWSASGTVPRCSPQAQYTGSFTFDDSIVLTYTDKVTNQTEQWYKVTGGSLSWTGTVGFEVTVNPSVSSGNVGGSFFGYTWTNSNVNLVTGARGTGSRCDLGIAGYAVVGTILCGVANPASSYAYSSSGAWVNTGATYNWAMARDLGNGKYELMMYSNRRTVTGGGNDLQERLVLSTVPVPGAVWLLGSAVGLLGWARRRFA